MATGSSVSDWKETPEGSARPDTSFRYFHGVTIINVGSVDFAPHITLLLSQVNGCRLLDKLQVITVGDPDFPKEKKTEEAESEDEQGEAQESAAAATTGNGPEADAQADEDEPDDNDDDTAVDNYKDRLTASAPPARRESQVLALLQKLHSVGEMQWWGRGSEA
ncbi:hypothetical protein ACFVHR_11690 [Streptomyces sp. NPDC127168]|uniref:hypothetical protein n=1 Tax=unclassified Streptomyces TaxID=2593676 RepID=UPI0036446DA5